MPGMLGFESVLDAQATERADRTREQLLEIFPPGEYPVQLRLRQVLQDPLRVHEASLELDQQRTPNDGIELRLRYACEAQHPVQSGFYKMWKMSRLT